MTYITEADFVRGDENNARQECWHAGNGIDCAPDTPATHIVNTLNSTRDGFEFCVECATRTVVDAIKRQSFGVSVRPIDR